MDVSVIIVNYRSWKPLERCLTTLLPDDLTPLDFQVIVVDNFSEDGLFEIYKNKFRELTWIQNSGNHGFAHGCNLGALQATAKYLLFLNPDTLIQPQSLQQLFDTYRSQPHIALLSCLQHNVNRQYYKQYKNFPSLLGLLGLARSGQSASPAKKELIYTPWVSGSLVFISKDWFDKVGGWNQDYWLYYEDVELCKKISLLQGTIALSRQCEIMHEHGGSSRIDFSSQHRCKTEVIISKHVYITNNFDPYSKPLAHFLLLLMTVFEKGLLSVLSLFIWSNTALKINRYILKNLSRYYWYALKTQSWLSMHSVNHPNKL